MYIFVIVSSSRCLIFGTDGLWNMISPEGAVTLVQATEGHNEAALVGGNGSQPRDWLNPSKSLVDHALERYFTILIRKLLYKDIFIESLHYSNKMFHLKLELVQNLFNYNRQILWDDLLCL